MFFKRHTETNRFGFSLHSFPVQKKIFLLFFYYIFCNEPNEPKYKIDINLDIHMAISINTVPIW